MKSNQHDPSYKAFARLTADWFWELDENLCFVFNDGNSPAFSGTGDDDLLGKSRIDVLRDALPHSDALQRHNDALENHESLDIVMPVLLEEQVRHINIIAEPKFDEHGRFSGYLGCGRDVTDRVAAQEQLNHLATHDDLTGVHNRREFERRLGLLCQRVKTSDRVYSLCFIDLDRFKNVNDTAGHPAGDQLLRELSGIMRKHIRSDEVIARLGGDEFGMLLGSNTTVARQVSERLIDAIARHEFLWEGEVHRVGASIGVVEIATGCGDVQQLMMLADNACYAAKHNGRNQSCVADDTLAPDQLEQNKVSLIKSALQASRYRLLMQPIICTSNQDPQRRYELLIRLECEDGRLLEPGEFMHMARHYQLMQQLDVWVVENALAAHPRIDDEDAVLSINLTVNSLADPRTLDTIVAIISESEVPGDRVCFDITETSAIRNIDYVIDFMHRLRAQGVEFALDDFGNGLSSFSYLQQLPIDFLKIDGELIRKLLRDAVTRSITTAFHQLAHQLGIRTVAESVEDQATIACIQDIGIDYMQGFGVADLLEIDGGPAQGGTQAGTQLQTAAAISAQVPGPDGFGVS